MHKKSLGLCCLLFSNILMASGLYTPQLVLSNKTDGLTIKFPPPVEDAGMPVGPTDATVIDNKFVVLDTYGYGVSFFDFNGTLLKKVALPRNIQFQNIVRDKDNSLFVFATDTNHTWVVHIQNEVITERTVYKTKRRYIHYVIPDDYGLIMMGSEVLSRPKDDDLPIAIQERIDRNCISCKPKSVKGIQVGGILYRITPGKNSAFFIGKKEIPLKLYPKFGMNAYEIIQVDQDGTAWIDNSIISNGPPITYVWKVNKAGEILGIYRFASDEEVSTTQWLMQRELIVSNDGKVYGLISNKKQFKFTLLKPLSVEEMKLRAKKLDSVLFKKEEVKSNKTKEVSKLQSEGLSTVGCRPRQKVIDEAYDYMKNKIYLSTSSIVNDATCPNRIIPPYLSAAKEKTQTYDSVSYNWGGFDTIAEFNKKIATDKMKAGNVNTNNNPLLSCAAGVDCSGYVSRAWGLTSKLGTWNIASDQITDAIDWNEVKKGDVYIVPGVHVMLYRMNDDFFGRSVYIAEANAEKGRVIQQIVPISWLKQLKYQPRRPKSSIICQ
jgi:hypothetical protein